MPDSRPSILDAHVHLWDTSRFDLPWLADVPELGVRSTIDDLLAAIGRTPVDRAVAVQAGQSAEEAAWLFGAAAGAGAVDFPLGVVLQYGPAAGRWLGEVQSVVDDLGRLPAGVRLPVHGRAADWTDLDGLDALVGGLEEHGLVLELLLRPDQVAIVHDIAAAHPQLDIVLCHLGLGTRAPTEEWRASMTRLTECPNVMAKVSGVFSPRVSAGEGDALARTGVAVAMDALGPDRLMFGSDWPMSTRVGNYTEVVERTAALLPELTPEESSAIWRRTAEQVYGAVRGRESSNAPEDSR